VIEPTSKPGSVAMIEDMTEEQQSRWTKLHQRKAELVLDMSRNMAPEKADVVKMFEAEIEKIDIQIDALLKELATK
jgi:hypothetical protein